MRERFFVALSFYTRIPYPQNLNYKKLPQASVFLPLIGWVVGAFLAGTFYLTHLIWSQNSAILLTLIVSVFLTGALHEDGFADVCDGFGGGFDKTRILEIMKDSHSGVFGFIGLLLLFLLKISALNELSASVIPVVFFAGQSVNRLAPLALMFKYDYAREHNSKIIGATYKLNKKEGLFALFLGLLPLLLLPTICLWVVVPLLLANFFLGRYFYHRIGGYTGDCLGASQQISEVIFYLSLSAIWKFI